METVAARKRNRAAARNAAWLRQDVGIGTDDNHIPAEPYAIASRDLHDADMLDAIELGVRVADALAVSK